MLALTEPTLLLDETKCKENIHRLIIRSHQAKVSLRPHFKTHQSHTIGRWYRDEGVTKITVSSLKMAEYFAEDGWNDITVAFPINVLEIDRINRLASKIKLNILIASREAADLLQGKLLHPLSVFIEVDNGYHRTGFPTDAFDEINHTLNSISQNSLLRFEGFLSHAGHSYKAIGPEEILKIHKASIRCMQPLKEKFKNQYPDLIISTGDTPTCSHAQSYPGIDEIRPGNLVFYDLTQNKIGSCNLSNIAVAMACPIVAKYPERNEVIVYGGGVHFSKDSLQENGQLHFGRVVTMSTGGWSTDDTGMYVKSLSQEHGIIHAEAASISNLKVGQFLIILPVHACLTADAMKSYTTLSGVKISRLD